MATLFISDLHLDPRRPAITCLFLDFLEQASRAKALYILGDLFEAWIGDDDDGELGRLISGALKTLNERGVAVYLMHGNRDFLLGERFAAASGATLVPESQVIDLYGTPTLIMHGDSLCTDDRDYQALRAQVRSPQWQARMLALPLGERRALARQLRMGSEQAIADKPSEILDVNPEAVLEAMRRHGVRPLIHGHTHRPAVHRWLLDSQPAERIVLGDWYREGSVVTCSNAGCRLETLPLGAPAAPSGAAGFA